MTAAPSLPTRREPAVNLAGLPELLTAADIGQALRLGKNSVYRLLSSGELPVIKLSERGLRVTKAALEAWLSSQVWSEGAGYALTTDTDRGGAAADADSTP
jgi:excisionase family DNA binding protein